MFVAIANSFFLFETTHKESHGLSPWSPFCFRGNAGMALMNVTDSDSETWRVNPCGQNPGKTGGKQTAFFSIFSGRSTYEFPYHLTLMMAINPTRFFRVWMSIPDSYGYPPISDTMILNWYPSHPALTNNDYLLVIFHVAIEDHRCF